MSSTQRRCTACTNDATRTAPHAGTVDFAGVLAEIHKGEGLCGPCLQQLQPRNHRRRTRIVWQDDGSPEVVTEEVKPSKLADLKLRIPHEHTERIRALADAKGWSMNTWCLINLHARVCGEEDASGE